MTVQLAAVQAAAARIAPYVHRTLILRSRTIERELGCEVHWKCENLQKVGAFKARGAVNAVLALDEAAACRGVLTHSSGNHAAALAYAAALRSIKCTVVMPDTSPQLKRSAVRHYGAEIVICPQPDRQRTCDELAARHGFTVVHPYEDPMVIAGAGTVALELFESVGSLDLLVAPIGGGGLLSGSAVVAKAMAPACALLGAEPAAADDAFRSFATGQRQPGVPSPRTVADGLMTGIGRINFEILSQHGARIVTVDEDAIIAAARFILERMKVVVEPSSAVVLAALRKISGELRGLRIGAIFTGGNTDFGWLPRGS